MKRGGTGKGKVNGNALEMLSSTGMPTGLRNRVNALEAEARRAQPAGARNREGERQDQAVDSNETHR